MHFAMRINQVCCVCNICTDLHNINDLFVANVRVAHCENKLLFIF